MGFKEFVDGKSVRTDWIDLRDQDYLPNLSVLKNEVSLDPKLVPRDPKTGLKTLNFGIRHQGRSGRCVGFALANLVDIQRNLQLLRLPGYATAAPPSHNKPYRPDVVSADMMYHMAFFHDRYPDLEEQGQQFSEGVRTLRSVIKGFYHHGVCMDWPHNGNTIDLKRWQSRCYNQHTFDVSRRFPTVEQAKSARDIGLGAYFRLASVLNHFHAALNDAEAILTSANIHDGWSEAVPSQGGIITCPPKSGTTGTHAFVITGYDEDGFHVLNSWGPEWGGYKGQAGIALWRYEDWARNVVDSWVLRLSVFAPSAFGASIGEKGVKGLHGGVRSGATPCSELVGHYMHLDDGFHVCSGSYPSFSNGWERTYDYLKKQFRWQEVVEKTAKTAEKKPKKEPYKGVLVWIPGSLEGTKSTFNASVQRKAMIKKMGLYPYSILWCNTFVEKSIEVLHGIFESCEEQAGADAAHLDVLIESRVAGVGRAFWRDIEMGAMRAVRGTKDLPHPSADADKLNRITEGFVKKTFLDLVKLKEETGCEIHVVAEGAGALVVEEVLRIFEEKAKDKACKYKDQVNWQRRDIFDTLHLIYPAIGIPRAKQVLLPFINKMNGKIEGNPRRDSEPGQVHVRSVTTHDAFPRARIYIPEMALEDRLHFGIYGKSVLQLVSRAFEDRLLPTAASDAPRTPGSHPARPFLGMAKMAEDKTFSARGALYFLSDISSQTRQHDCISQVALNNDPTITEEIFKTIIEYGNPKRSKK